VTLHGIGGSDDQQSDLGLTQALRGLAQRRRRIDQRHGLAHEQLDRWAAADAHLVVGCPNVLVLAHSSSLTGRVDPNRITPFS
jgi:hypothetical protein